MVSCRTRDNRYIVGVILLSLQFLCPLGSIRDNSNQHHACMTVMSTLVLEVIFIVLNEFH